MVLITVAHKTNLVLFNMKYIRNENTRVGYFLLKYSTKQYNNKYLETK